jgi:hypothetical protein
MSRTLLAGLLAVVGLSLLAGASPAKAIAVRLSPLPERVALADAVVVGKVTAIEEKTVSASPYPGVDQKVEYQVAVIKIEDGLSGLKCLTHVKVGFFTPQAQPGGPRIRPPGRFGPPALTLDQEGCFFLKKHHTEAFYTAPQFDSVLVKAGNDNFGKEVAQVKRCAALLADPKAGLKAKDADERSLTAGMLLMRYGRQTTGNEKREPIDAEESKLILQALADGDWGKPFSPAEITPPMAFGMLNLQPTDGWNPGGFANQNDYAAAAKKWLKDNAGTYRVQRFVSDK